MHLLLSWNGPATPSCSCHTKCEPSTEKYVGRLVAYTWDLNRHRQYSIEEAKKGHKSHRTGLIGKSQWYMHAHIIKRHYTKYERVPSYCKRLIAYIRQ